MHVKITADGAVRSDDATLERGGYRFLFDGFLYGRPGNEHAAFFGEALDRDGPACVKQLDGCFRGWIHDAQARTLYAFTDRHAGKDLYRAEKGGTICFSSDFNRIARFAGAEPDPVGLAEFAIFGYPLYEKTFARGVSFVAPATFFTCRPGGGDVREERYWSFRYDYGAKGAPEQRRDALWELIGAATRSCAPDASLVYGVGNSGGMDSRMIIFTLAGMEREMRLFTIGNAPSDTVHIANRVAAHFGLPNALIPIEPDFLVRHAERMLRERPMCQLKSSLRLSHPDRLPRFDVHLTGFNGSNMLGSHLDEERRGLKGFDAVCRYTFDHYTVAPPYYREVLAEPSLMEGVEEHFRARMRETPNERPEDIAEEFNFTCRQLRFIKNSPGFDFLTGMHWRTPFLGREIMDFMLTMDAAERMDRALVRAAVRRHMYALAPIRYERGPLSDADTSPLVAALKKKLWAADWHLRRRLGRSFWFRGRHKNVTPLLIRPESHEFIARALAAPDERFDALFRRRRIGENLDRMLSEKPLFVSLLLGVKMWCALMDGGARDQ
ncbi:MAG: hypothetical protein FJ278_02670 [Planctomycetes bacterium]|nr:hypothetical protein [Planctomycetota bacterium]